MRATTFSRFFISAPLLLSAFGFSLNAHAIAISSGFEFADETGSATYTITNVTDNRIFVNAVMYELYLDKGKVQTIPYTRANIKDWKIEVHPARAVINPGFEKDFRVTLKCRDKCESLEDQAFQIGFVPTPYFSEDEPPQRSMQVAVGFAANFVFPGKESKLSYNVKRNGNALQIHNKGNAIFKAKISSCSANATKDEKKKCEQNINVLGQRQLSVNLLDDMVGKPLKVHLESVGKKYQEDISVAL